MDIVNSDEKTKKSPSVRKLNPWYAYLDTCSTFHQNVNKEMVGNIHEVARGFKLYSNGRISRTNKKTNYDAFLGYLETWFQG